MTLEIYSLIAKSVLSEDTCVTSLIETTCKDWSRFRVLNARFLNWYMQSWVWEPS